jgi:nucleotide-binding universal stress UspA family protein
MVRLANAIAMPVVGRVLLLTVVKRPSDFKAAEAETTRALHDATEVVEHAMSTSLMAGHKPEALMTLAFDPWREIARVARARECESLLLGLSSLEGHGDVRQLEQLLNQVDCDVVVLRAPPQWSLSEKTRVVVPVGGKGGHDELRARLLGSFGRAGFLNVRFIQVAEPGLSPLAQAHRQSELRIFAQEEARGTPECEVLESDDVVETLAAQAGHHDLIILGLLHQRHKRLFSKLALQVARKTEAATLMISRKV